jgi:hypothetical protein
VPREYRRLSTTLEEKHSCTWEVSENRVNPNDPHRVGAQHREIERYGINIFGLISRYFRGD